jgi:hypothetical protein
MKRNAKMTKEFHIGDSLTEEFSKLDAKELLDELSVADFQKFIAIARVVFKRLARDGYLK